jgi:uncharacterized protein (DUF1800 family)
MSTVAAQVPQTHMDTSLRALNRFGLGARIGERRTLDDPRAWLRAQLEGGPRALSPPAAASPETVAAALRDLRSAGPSNDRRRQVRARLVEIASADARAAIEARVTSDRPFVERLVAFWSNHLCVSAAAKLLVAPLAGAYERDVIRPHVLGRFHDMVAASAKHPAMLLYLDNFQSIGPGSQAARAARRGRETRRGLNENYARELLELHTLGVNGGYTQEDVQELARILTGWTVGGVLRGARRRRGRPAADDGPVRFAFEPLLHEPGSKTVLGVRYADAGVREGEEAIRLLCRHPSTAQFVATKLVAHFVSDEPPAAAIERVAHSFRSSEGDLAAVARALVDLPDAWSDASRKFRAPQEWIVAVLRAFNAREVGNRVLNVLRQLRHPLWAPQAPKGFGDTMQEWADPDALLNRAELARTIAGLIGDRMSDPRALLDVVDVGPEDPLRRLVGDRSIAASERVALAIAGPAFQWR